MKLLHCSDFHFDSSHDQSRVLEAFFADVGCIHASGRFDAIVLSGDLAAKGNTAPDLVSRIKTELIDKLRAALPGVPAVVCSGNHDVDLRSRNKIYNTIFQITSTAEANDLVDSSFDMSTAPVWEHLAGYRAIAQHIDANAYATNPLFYTTTIPTAMGTVGLASLNSAWLTTGGGPRDYGMLFLGERQIDLAAKALSNCALRVAVMHHSLEWLNPKERGYIQRALASNFHAVLCGHNHENTATTLTSNIGSVFVSNTGCIYQTREYFNGYSIIEFDPAESAWYTSAREYYFQRNCFDVAVRFAENGSHKFVAPNATNNSLISISGALIDGVQERAAAKLL